MGQDMKWARHAVCVIYLRRLVCWTDVPRQKLLVITLIEEERAAFYSCQKLRSALTKILYVQKNTNFTSSLLVKMNVFK